MAVPVFTDLGSYMRGDTVEITAWCKNADGSPMDLTGATIWTTFKTSMTDDDAVPPGFQRSTTGAGVVIVGLPEDGVAKTTIDPTNTASLVGTTVFNWDIQVRLPSGRTSTQARGSITFEEDVTRTVA